MVNIFRKNKKIKAINVKNENDIDLINKKVLVEALLILNN